MDRLTIQAGEQLVSITDGASTHTRTTNEWLALARMALRPDSSGEAVRPEGLDEVLAELRRALTKFPTWPTDPLHAVAVLGEEYGELVKDVLQFTYEPHKTNRIKVREEAIQTAAMALRFVASLSAYDYKRGPQHKQGSGDGK